MKVMKIDRMILKKRKFVFDVVKIKDGEEIDTGLKEIDFFNLMASNKASIITGKTKGGNIKVVIKRLKVDGDAIVDIPAEKQEVSWFAVGK